MSAIFLGWTQRNLSKLLPIKSNSRHINLWNFKVAPCIAVLVFSFLMRSSSSSSFPSWSMEESRTCLYAGGEENSSLICVCQTVNFLSVVFLSVCRLGSWKMELALWQGPSKTTSLTVLNRKLSTSWGLARRSTAIWLTKLGPCSPLPVFTVILNTMDILRSYLTVDRSNLYQNAPINGFKKKCKWMLFITCRSFCVLKMWKCENTFSSLLCQGENCLNTLASFDSCLM